MSACAFVCFLPGLFLQDEVRLHKELDAQPQPARRHVVHLLADAVPQIEPQVLALAAGELQAQVVHLNDAQLPAHLQGGAAESNRRSLHTHLGSQAGAGGEQRRP